MFDVKPKLYFDRQNKGVEKCSRISRGTLLMLVLSLGAFEATLKYITYITAI